METSMLSFVIAELQARKGKWAQIAREMDPESWESYYSWMTKVVYGQIPDPSVNKIEALANRFRAEQRAA